MSQARNWLCTKHMEDGEGWKDYLKDLHEKTKARYTVGQLEKGGETGAIHIQFFLNFEKPTRIGAITKHDKTIHCEKVLVNNGADTYCMKEETRIEGPIEFGTKPVKRNNKVDWNQVWENAKNGDLDKIPPSIRVVHYNKIKAITKDHMKFNDSDHLRGVWIYGPSGSGKSRWVREQAVKHQATLYPKLCNKWWDGYQGEQLVVMDDLMPEHKVLNQQLKIWADRYDCILETKGGAVHAKYQWFIVTSQYKPEEIFTGDDRDLEAILRRFQIFNIGDIDKFDLAVRGTPNVYNTQDVGVPAK